MELRHLRYFVAVAEAGSVTLAAEERLHTSQPSLSRQIRLLEEEVGAELLTRGARGVELTPSGTAFLEHARLALRQVEQGVEAARRAATPQKRQLSVGFLTGQEMIWLPEAMRILRDELPNVDVTVSSGYAPDLAEAVARGRLDLAFTRADPEFDVEYQTVCHEPLLVLMPNDHPLSPLAAVPPHRLTDFPFVGMSQKARVLRGVIDAYFERCGLSFTPSHGADTPAVVFSLITSVKALALLPANIANLLPPTITSRPLEGDTPTIELVVAYSKTNGSPMLKLFLSRLHQVIALV